MTGWNLARLVETLLPLFHDEQEQAIKMAQDAIAEFIKLYHENWYAGMRAKLGFSMKKKRMKRCLKTI